MHVFEGHLSGVRIYRQVVLNDVEEKILREIHENTVTLDDLMSVSSIVEKMGPLDYSIMPEEVKTLPLMDLPKRMMVKTVVESLVSKGLVRMVEDTNKLEVTDTGQRFITGDYSIPEGIKLVHSPDGEFVLKPYQGVMYELLVNVEGLKHGVYHVLPVVDIGALESVVVVPEGYTSDIIPIKVLLLENTTKLKRGDHVVNLTRVC